MSQLPARRSIWQRFCLVAVLVVALLLLAVFVSATGLWDAARARSWSKRLDLLRLTGSLLVSGTRVLLHLWGYLCTGREEDV